jgi:hypothetical protein
MTAIEATIFVSIDHTFGPVIADPGHVRRWLVADGQWIGGERNGFTYEICPQCPNPDECGHSGEVSIYRALIVSANWDE